MPFVKLNWRPSPRDLRQFGFIFGAGFLLVGLVKYFWLWNWFLERDEKLGLILISIGILGGGLGLTGTYLALPIYYLWLALAFVLGNITSRLAVSLIYFGVITPLGILARIIGRDKLQLKKQDVSSYWKDVSLPVEQDKYKRQF